MAPKRKSVRSQSPTKGRQHPAKVAKKEKDPIEEKIQIITDAIEKHEEDESIMNLITKAASVSFKPSREERHKFYNECIEMVDTKLTEFLEKFKKEIETMRGDINNADNLKVENARRRDELAELLEKEKEKIAAKEDDLEKLVEQVEHTERELKKRKKDSNKAFEPLEKATKELVEAKKQKQVLADLCAALVDNKNKERKKQITAINNYIKSFGDEYAALTASLPNTLQKADRGTFDETVLATAAGAMDKNVARLEAVIQGEKVGHAPLLKALADAENAATLAEEARQKAQGELEELEAGREGLQNTRKATDKALKDHDKNVRELAANLTKTTEDHKELQMVYRTMEELRDRSGIIKEEVASTGSE